MGIPLRIAPRRAMIGIVLVCVVFVPSSHWIAATELTRKAGTANESTDQMIRKLIEKLGSDSYATRIRARNQLKTFGLEAFDALREAQNHDDSEILSAARYLISSLQVSWSKDSDPKEVREILFEYGAQSESERLGRIELLGGLRGQMGVEALARLARFDRSVPLSRRAAMLVLKQPLGREKVGRQRLADQIETVIGENQRDASKWLLAYAKDLRDGSYSQDRWRELVRLQRKKVDSGASSNVTSASVMQLIRMLATRAIAEGAREPALSLVDEHIDLVAPATRDLAEHAGWSIRKSLFPIVISLYERHKHAFNENAELLYSAAHAFKESGQPELAEQLAASALQINPLPEIVANDDDESDPEDDAKKQNAAITDHQLQEIALAHHQVAFLLKTRGCFDWSERENRAITRHCDIETQIGVVARQELGSMFSEQLRHQEATDVLFPIADRAQKDRLYQATLNRWRLSSKRIQSLYQYESGLALLEKKGNDSETLSEVKGKLQLAYRFYSDNIDILIRMYRLEDPNDPDWKSTVVKQIEQNIEKLEQDISRYESRKKMIPPDQYKEGVGEHYNQYAWLVSNTEGDYERALKYSLSSLEFLDSDDVDHRAARLDTCARCFFALGRVDEAIQTQKQAIILEPFSPPMNRQLKQFEAAL